MGILPLPQKSDFPAHKDPCSALCFDQLSAPLAERPGPGGFDPGWALGGPGTCWDWTAVVASPGVGECSPCSGLLCRHVHTPPVLLPLPSLFVIISLSASAHRSCVPKPRRLPVCLSRCPKQSVFSPPLCSPTHTNTDPLPARHPYIF